MHSHSSFASLLLPCAKTALAHRLYGQEVAIKCVDAYNSKHLVSHLQKEADVLSGGCLVRRAWRALGLAAG